MRIIGIFSAKFQFKVVQQVDFAPVVLLFIQ